MNEEYLLSKMDWDTDNDKYRGRRKEIITYLEIHSQELDICFSTRILKFRVLDPTPWIILKRRMTRKSDYVCLCVSHRCGDGIVTLPLGEKQAGKLVSRQTLNNHCKADEVLYESTKNEGPQHNTSMLQFLISTASR